MYSAFVNNPTAIIVIVGLVVLLFGGTKIPEMMKGVGQGVREFKKGINSDPNEEDDELKREKERERIIKERVEAEMKAGK